MRRSFQKACIILVASFFSLTAAGQVPTEKISELILSGNASGLAEHFSPTLDIGLPDKDQDYSKEQGERVIKEFFEKNPPSGFSIEEEGELGDDSHFIIASYVSGKSNFQAYLILKQKEKEWVITKLKFEKE